MNSITLKQHCKHVRISDPYVSPVWLKQCDTTAQVTSPGGLLDVLKNLTIWQIIEKGRFESCCILCQSEDNKGFWLLDLENKYEPAGFREKMRNWGICTAWSKVQGEDNWSHLSGNKNIKEETQFL